MAVGQVCAEAESQSAAGILPADQNSNVPIGQEGACPAHIGKLFQFAYQGSNTER